MFLKQILMHLKINEKIKRFVLILKRFNVFKLNKTNKQITNFLLNVRFFMKGKKI